MPGSVIDSWLCESLSVVLLADNNTSALTLGARIAFSSNLDDDIMLNCIEMDVDNKEQAATEMPPHSVVLKKILEMIKHVVAKLS